MSREDFLPGTVQVVNVAIIQVQVYCLLSKERLSPESRW